ncbi:hypothetical protein F4820DRAFT_449018 [Hypoxylon rubiginosum]|uniref:Uncharacterized protein n=1 Tax=Hypoxylon rubiginosum TaxID=110542 RepID=A0ACB9YZF1_9PEZI|nr:hypothetical protein F4820DRAFT_449018 [Hypoxylon rubiginosum]
MRSRNKACSYPVVHGGSAVSTPPQSQPSDGEATFGSSPGVAGSKAPGRDARQDELPRREVWQSSALADVLVTIPSGIKPNSSGSPSTASKTPTQGPVFVDQDENAKGNQPSSHGLRTNSNAVSYMDTYPISGIILKKRYFFPTHWAFTTTLSPHALDWLEREVRNQGPIWQDLTTCKCLGRSIKSARVLPWTQGEYGKHLPIRRVADDLFEAYLRTFESVYRIVHIPTSKRAYEIMWENPGLASMASPAYVVQLQLCLAIGACFHDETFSLRPQALQWIREAEHWLESSGKPRATVFDIQTGCLLHLARWTTQHMREHQVWHSSGALVRAAMSVGLHRDPAKLPNMPALEAEMRRRLWATIMELVLDSSIDAGGPPMLSPDDFDCSLPLNLNDAELDNTSGPGEVAYHDPAEFTDTSIQIALGRTFAMRLSIAKYVNSIKAEDSHKETLRLSSDLMAEYRSLVKTLHSLHPAPTKFQQQYCELVMSRYIFALHITYMPRALKDPAQFYFSRTLCVDTALRLSSFSLPLSSSLEDPLLAAMHNVLPFASHCDDWVRLVTNGSGPFRSVPFAAAMVVAAELTAIIHQTHDTSPWMGVIPLNQTQTHMGSGIRIVELLSLLREATKWMKARIQAGQPNMKDLVFITVVLAGIEAAMEGIPAEKAMDAKGREALAEGVRILAEMAGTATSTWNHPPGTCDEGFGIGSEYWSIGFSGMDWDTMFQPA